MSVIDLLRDSYLEKDNPVVTVQLVDLINTLTGSCDSGSSNDDWFNDAAMDKLSDDPMGYLIDSLLTYGFVTPLNVFTENDGASFIMGNGHHRLIAAAFSGFTEVPVYAAPYIDWKRSETGDQKVLANEDYPVMLELFEAYEDGLSSIRDAIDGYSYDQPSEVESVYDNADQTDTDVMPEVEDDYIKFFEGQMYVQDCACPTCADLQARRDACDLIVQLNAQPIVFQMYDNNPPF